MDSARDEAARLLAARGLSEAELRTRLTARGHPEGEVEDALAHALEARWLDDAALAASILRAGIAKGRGRARLLQELERRGIASAAGEAAWRELLAAGEAAPGEALADEVARRVGSEGGRLTGKAVTRVYNALLRLGHDEDAVRAALAPYVGDDDDLP